MQARHNKQAVIIKFYWARHPLVSWLYGDRHPCMLDSMFMSPNVWCIYQRPARTKEMFVQSWNSKQVQVCDECVHVLCVSRKFICLYLLLWLAHHWGCWQWCLSRFLTLSVISDCREDNIKCMSGNVSCCWGQHEKAGNLMYVMSIMHVCAWWVDGWQTAELFSWSLPRCGWVWLGQALFTV